MKLPRLIILKQYSVLFLMLTLTLSLSVARSRGADAGDGQVAITILHTNDIHAHLSPDANGKGGMAAIAAYIKSVRRERPGHVLTLDAGDMTQGTPVSTLYQGKPIFEIMNLMGYDAAVLGNHEFDNGHALIAEFRRIAEFPILSATAAHGGKLLADAPSKIFEIAGLRIGVLGLTTNLFAPKDIEFIDPEKAVEEHLPPLKAKSDISIALTHWGMQSDTLFAATSGKDFDLIVGGHSHTRLDAPVRIGKTAIVQTGEHAWRVGRVDIVYDTRAKKIVSIEGRLIDMPAPGLEPDPPTRATIEKWEEKANAVVNVKIGHHARRMRESELTRVIARVWRDTYKTDFGYQNSGGTRGSLPQGDILARDVWVALPFDNTIAILRLTRDQIGEEIGRSLFDEEKPLYSLVTNSYTADRIIDKYNLPPERYERLSENYRDPIVAHIKEHGGLISVLEPVSQ